MDVLGYVIYRLNEEGKIEYYCGCIDSANDTIFTKQKKCAFIFSTLKRVERISRLFSDSIMIHGIGTDKELREFIGEDTDAEAGTS